MTNLDSILKSRDITLPTQVHIIKAVIFPVVTHRCQSWTIKKSWAPKNWCFWTMMLEKTLGSPLDSKEIQPVSSKGNQSWIIIGMTEAPILWPPDAKRRLIIKDPDAGGDWRQEEKEMTEDEMVRCHHGLNRTWVWASSGRWWRTRKPGVLQSTGSQRVRHNWVTETNWTDIYQTWA